MTERIQREVNLLKSRYSELEYRDAGQWVLLPDYTYPPGWNCLTSKVAFQIPIEYPGNPPYAFYVPSGVRFNTQMPSNYTDVAPMQPPFGGNWGVFSWAPDDGVWQASASIETGPNLLHWALGFQERLKAGV